MVYAKLFQDERSQADVDFYDTAKTLQKKSQLSDGCRSSEFMAKAYAWIYKIRPHLAQQYSDSDAAEYIVQLMPKRLGSDARRIREDMRRAGTLGNLMSLARELEKIVYADQNATPPAPAMVSLDANTSSRFDLLSLAAMTSMSLIASGARRSTGSPGTNDGPPGVQLKYGVDGKWCSKCGNHEPSACFLDPTWGWPATSLPPLQS